MRQPTICPSSVHFAAAIALAGLSVSSTAAIPQAAKDDPRYKLGYLVVTHYPGVDTNGVADSLAGLQAAVNDAYANGLVTLFPSGSYLISDTLRCRDFHVAAGTNADGSIRLAANPCQSYSFILQGSSIGPRPVIRLADAPSGDFDNTGSVRPILMYRLYESTSYPNSPQIDPPDSNILGAPSGYKVDSSYLFNWELRNVDIDCNGHPGAVGVVFPAAQGSLIANVRVDATGAFAGFYGLPGRNWGAVNIEVDGGRYGIRTGGPAGGSVAGSSIFGARLVNQTIAAIDHEDFVPLVMAGFRIVRAFAPAFEVKDNYSTYTAWNTMSLLDGSIEITGGLTASAAIGNPGGKNLYLRNIYVGGATSLVKSATRAPLTGSGPWSRIDEYSYTDQRTTAAGQPNLFTTWSMIDGVTNRNAERVKLATPNTGSPPNGLLSLHLPWHGMPTYEGAGSPPTLVVTDPPYDAAPGDATDDTYAIQRAIDDASAAGHGRVFIPKFNSAGTSSGAFLLTNTITLRHNTMLFGAAKAYVSELRTHPTWRPTVATDIVRTDDDADATTYLGNLALATDVSLYRNPFTFYHWRAGAASETFDLRLETVYEYRPPANPNHYTGVRYSGNAGGRHFFFPEAELDKVGNSAGPYPSNNGDQYRSLRVTGTSQPLWLYGFNLEGGKHDLRGFDAEIHNAANIRWLGWKREGYCSMLLLSNCQNFALYSAGAMREDIPEGDGRFRIAGACSNILLANLLVQADNGTDLPSSILIEALPGQPTHAIPYPECISIFRRGTPDDQSVRVGIPLALPAIDAAYTPGGFVLRLRGAPGLRYGIETSTNLIAWTPWASVVAPDGILEILDPDAAHVPQKFYRALPP